MSTVMGYPPKFRYGDLICYRLLVPGEAHDGPLMYVCPCGHSRREGGGSGLIDILDLEGNYTTGINHKDGSVWQLCKHFDE